MPAEEREQHDLADARDKERDEVNAKVVAEANSESMFSRLWKYNEPKYLVVIGLIGTFMVGCAQPLWSVFYSRIVTYMTVPLNLIEYIYASQLVEDEKGEEFILRQSYYVVAAAMGLVVLFGGGSGIRQQAFGTLSETMTTQIRKITYGKLLEKDIGWFDDRKRATSVLTSTMAEGTERINDAGATALQPMVTATFTVCCGLCVSCYFCWPMGLGALCVIPI